MISRVHMAGFSSTCRRLMPYLAIAGAMIEADRIFDIQILAWPVLAALAICAVLSLNRR
jgi:uncharacterized membrane protein YoaT (DUF817 family)